MTLSDLFLGRIPNILNFSPSYRERCAIKCITFWLFALLAQTPALAQAFRLLTTDNGLSSSIINNVCYAGDGNIWIATEDGLNRYDGSRITVYKNVPGDSTSLVHNFVNDVFEDSKGRIYVSTHGGLQIYDEAHDSFSPIAVDEDGNKHISSTSKMLERKNGDLWIFGNQPRIVEHGKDGRLILKRINLSENIQGANVAFEDNEGTLWVSLDKKGVYRIFPNNSVKHYLGKQGDPIISSFALGTNNVIYAGSIGDGLYRFDKVKDAFESLSFDNKSRRLIIKNLYPDTDGNIMLATDGTGLKTFNPSTGNTVDIDLPLNNSNNLKVHTVTHDEFGNTWIGIFQKGVMMIPRTDNNFFSIRGSNQNSLIGSSCITSIYREKNGRLWIGTDNDGIYSLSPDLTVSKHFYGEDTPKVIQDIFQDSRGTLWIGSYDMGVGTLDKTTGKYTPLTLIDENGIEAKRVYDVTEMSNGDIIFATMGSGIFNYNPATGIVSKSVKINNQINPWTTSAVFSKRNDCLYVGTYSGLYKIESDSTVRPLKNDLIVTSIYDDTKRNALWIASTAGLVKVKDGGIIERIFDVSDGLPSNTVYAVEDDGKYLWISTNSGLSKLDPVVGSCTNYYVGDGLQSNEFYKKTSFNDKESRTMFFGGVNGLTYFNPDNVERVGRKYHLTISGFYVGEKPVKAGMKSGSRTIVNEPVSKAKVFKLSSNDNSFSVEFNTKEFNRSAQTYFLYSFDGNEWEKLPLKSPQMGSSAGTQTLNFSNVHSGKHTLKIKAVDNGIESDPISIDIDVAPTWYNTTLARICYALIALILIWFTHNKIKKRSRLQKEEAQRLHEEEIKESKLQFFTNISHEIRTPLSLVISPLQTLIDSTDPNDKNLATYRTMHRNSLRILRLVNELMDLRKIDNKSMILSYQKTQLTDFISDLCDTFRQAAEKKDITLTFSHPGCDDLSAWVDVSNFDKIIMNLLSNAVKYTPNGGKIDVTLSQGMDLDCKGPLHDYVEISVCDTGIGIPKEARAQVFERFYQVANNNTGGTGIGLHLTHSLVKLHHGTITLEDNPEGQGSKFVVRIPLGNAHLRPEEMIVDATVDAQPLITQRPEFSAEISVGPDSKDEATAGVKRNRSVFIVEDDTEVRNYLLENLGKDFRITAFANGNLAFEAICKNAPDLVITDVMMPGIDGLTLARKIKQNINLNHIPVILLTAKNRDEDTLEGLDSGADAYITKPFNTKILIKTAHNLIDSNQRLRNAFSGNQNQADKLEEIQATSGDDKLMERLMKVINKHISDSEITVEMIAEEIGISRVHLHRKLKELTNQTTRDFIRNIRLQQAAKLLREKKLTVAEVSYLVGFKHPNNFSTNFKEMFGMSPTAYSELHHSQNNA